MISASKTSFSLNNLKILRPKVTNLLKKFCKFPPRAFLNKHVVEIDYRYLNKVYDWTSDVRSYTLSLWFFAVLFELLWPFSSHSMFVKYKYLFSLLVSEASRRSTDLKKIIGYSKNTSYFWWIMIHHTFDTSYFWYIILLIHHTFDTSYFWYIILLIHHTSDTSYFWYIILLIHHDKSYFWHLSEPHHVTFHI